jgi:hypothetical protein
LGQTPTTAVRAALAGSRSARHDLQSSGPKEAVVEFIQIIEMRSDKFDELMALEDEWRKATEGKRTLRRSILTRDRNDPQRYRILAFFDSYESAMENSNLPETTAFGQKQAALLDAPAVFSDLDVVADSS